MGFFGGLAQGLNQIPGIMQRGQQMQMQAEEHKLKAKMLEFQMKKAEQEQQQQQQQEQGLESYLRGLTGQPEQQIETEPGDVPLGNQVQGQPGFRSAPASPQEQFGLSLRAVRPQDRYHLIQQQQKVGETGMTPYQRESLNLRQVQLDRQAEGGYGVQSRIWFKIAKENPGADLATLTRIYNNEMAQQRYATGAGGGAGTQMGEAAAVTGQPIPPMPPFAGQPTPAPSPQLPSTQPAPQQPRIHPGFPGGGQPPVQPQAPTAPQAGKSLPLQSKEAVARASKRGANQAEAEEAMVGLSSAMDLVNELDQLSAQIFSGSKSSSYLQRGAGAVGEYARSWDPASLEGMYEARKQTVGENLARQIGGVKGTATEGDIYRMLIALPKVGKGETKESRDYKIGAFRKIIELAIDKKQRYINGEPIDLEKSRQEFNRMVTQFTAGTFKPPKGRLVPLSSSGGQ